MQTHISQKWMLLFRYRDAVSDLALHFLAKMKIMVIKDIDREEVEFVCKVSSCSSCDLLLYIMLKVLVDPPREIQQCGFL